MRFFRIVLPLALVLLLAAGAMGFTLAGDTGFSRLWTVSPDGEFRFACSAVYVAPVEDMPSLAWVVSAGHCALARTVRLGREEGSTVRVVWRAIVDGVGKDYDVAVGIAEDTRPESESRFRVLASNMPPCCGQLLSIHSFHRGVEMVTAAHELHHDAIPAHVRVVIPGVRVLVVPVGTVGPGSSGGAVLDANGELVAIVWGGTPVFAEDGTNWVFVIPVERIREVARMAGMPVGA